MDNSTIQTIVNFPPPCFLRSFWVCVHLVWYCCNMTSCISLRFFLEDQTRYTNTTIDHVSSSLQQDSRELLIRSNVKNGERIGDKFVQIFARCRKPSSRADVQVHMRCRPALLIIEFDFLTFSSRHIPTVTETDTSFFSSSSVDVVL